MGNQAEESGIINTSTHRRTFSRANKVNNLEVRKAFKDARKYFKNEVSKPKEKHGKASVRALID